MKTKKGLLMTDVYTRKSFTEEKVRDAARDVFRGDVMLETDFVLGGGEYEPDWHSLEVVRQYARFCSMQKGGTDVPMG